MSTSSEGSDEQIDISDIESVDDIDNVALFDPKVEAELERLSSAADRIKDTEAKLDRARSDFTSFMSETSASVKNLSTKLGSCVVKAKKSHEVGIKIRELLSEAETSNESMESETSNEFEQESKLLQETEKTVHKLQQELKKSINKSCLSTRRSLLQLNNLANQHQLQLLPYFEMKSHFIQMFEEQMKRVPPLDSDWKMKIRDDIHFMLEESNGMFQDIIDDERSIVDYSKDTNSVTSSYKDSLSSENMYLEQLTSEDMYLDLPSSINITQGLVNCTVSSCKSDGYFKSIIKHQSTDADSFEDVSHKTNHEGFFLESNSFQFAKEEQFNNVNHCLIDEMFSVEDLSSKRSHACLPSLKSSIFRHDSEMLKQINDTILNDTLNEMSEINDMLPDKKSSDSESSILNFNNLLIDIDEMSISDSVSSNDPI